MFLRQPEQFGDAPMLRGTTVWQRLSEYRAHDRVRVLTLWESGGSTVSLQAGKRGSPSLQWTSGAMIHGAGTRGLLDRLFAVLDGLSDAAFAVALVQAVGAILLIANMVQVAAYTRRNEVGIMRLVGATRWYTQLPFLVEAIVAATLGVVIAIVGLMVVRALFLDNALRQFYQAHLIAKVDYADILYISPLLLLVGVAMAGVTSYATLRLYVRR